MDQLYLRWRWQRKAHNEAPARTCSVQPGPPDGHREGNPSTDRQATEIKLISEYHCPITP